jgi:hypothetical protein
MTCRDAARKPFHHMSPRFFTERLRHARRGAQGSTEAICRQNGERPIRPMAWRGAPIRVSATHALRGESRMILDGIA